MFMKSVDKELIRECITTVDSLSKKCKKEVLESVLFPFLSYLTIDFVEYLVLPYPPNEEVRYLVYTSFNLLKTLEHKKKNYFVAINMCT